MATFSGDVQYSQNGTGKPTHDLFHVQKKKSGWPLTPKLVSGQAMDSMDPGSTRKLRVKFTTNFTW